MKRPPTDPSIRILKEKTRGSRMKPKLSRIHQKKRHRAQEDTHHFSYGNKLSSGHRYGYRRDKKDSIHESNRQRKTTPCGKTKIPRVCQELRSQSSRTSLLTSNIESASQRRRKRGWLLSLLRRKSHRGRSRVVR